MKRIYIRYGLIVVLLLFSGCATYTTKAKLETREHLTLPTFVYGAFSNVRSNTGTAQNESSDLIMMTHKMTRDILSSPEFINRNTPHPFIIIDGKYFKDEGLTETSKNRIINILCLELDISANDELLFIKGNHVDMVDKQTNETVPDADYKFASYRLEGSITTKNSANPDVGDISHYLWIYFEMVDLNTKKIVWRGSYMLDKKELDKYNYVDKSGESTRERDRYIVYSSYSR